MRNKKSNDIEELKNGYFVDRYSNFEQKTNLQLKLKNLMDIFQNPKHRREETQRELKALKKDVKKTLLDTLYFNGNKTDKNILVVGTDLIELGYVQKFLSIDVIEHFFKNIGKQKVNFYDNFIKELDDFFKENYGYKGFVPKYIVDKENYKPKDWDNGLKGEEKIFKPNYFYSKFPKLDIETMKNLDINSCLEIFETMMKDVENIEDKEAKRIIKRELEKKYHSFFEREYNFFRSHFYKYYNSNKANFTNFLFSRSDIEKSPFFKNNQHYKRMSEWFIFQEDKDKPFDKNFKTDNFYATYNLYLIDNVNETEQLLLEIENKMKIYKIEHLIILDKNRLENLDMSIIMQFAKKNNLNLITENMTINYGILQEESVLLQTLEQKEQLKENKQIKNFFTIDDGKITYDTLNIRDLQIFNYFKELFYSNFNFVNLTEFNGWIKGIHYEEVNGQYDTIHHFLIDIINKYSAYPEFYADEKRKEKTINLKVIDIAIDDRSTIESFKLLGRNFGSKDVFFKNSEEYNDIDIYNEDLIYFLFGTLKSIHEHFDENGIDYLVYELEDINKEENINKKNLFNIIVKYYKEYIPYLQTNEGSKINNVSEYLKIEKDIEINENKLYDNFQELIYLVLKNKSFFGVNEKHVAIYRSDFNAEEDEMNYKIKNGMKQLFFDYSMKHLALFNTNNANNDKLIKVAMQNLLNYISEAAFAFWQNEKEDYKKDSKWKELGLDKKTDEELFNIVYPNFIYPKNIKININSEKKYFSTMQKTIQKTMNATRNLLEVNFQLNNMFPTNRLFVDFEKILNGENIFNLKNSDFEKLKEEIKNIEKDEEFKKFKTYSKVKIFSDKKMYEYKDEEQFDIDTKLNRKYGDNRIEERMIGFYPSLHKYQLEEISEERKKEIFKKETRIGEYFLSDIKNTKEQTLKHDVVQTKHISEFYDPIIKKLSNEEKNLYLKIKNKNIYLVPQSNPENNFLYYYHAIFEDVKSKIKDKSLSINQSEKIISKIVNEFLLYKNNNHLLEKSYFNIKSEISSLINENKIIFNKDDINTLELFLHTYLPYMNKIKDIDKEKFLQTINHILEQLKNTDNCVIDNMLFKDNNENIRSKQLSFENFNYVYILKIFLNNVKSIQNDPILNMLSNFSLLKDLIEPNLLEDFLKKTLRSNQSYVELLVTTDIEFNEEVTNSDIELLAYRNKMDDNFKRLKNNTEISMESLGKSNYEYIFDNLCKKFGIEKVDTGLYDILKAIVEENIRSKSDLNSDVSNPLFAVIVKSNTSELLVQTLEEICKKHNFSIIIGKIEYQNDIKTFKPTELLNNSKGYNKEGKLEFNLINKTRIFDSMEYDTNVLKINNPLEQVNVQRIKFGI